jgi:3-oxoacyl-[acyl-carrier protein] reductase
MPAVQQIASGAQAVEFSSIDAGDSITFHRTIADADVDAFAALSGDYNPLHMDAEYARRTHLRHRVVHGMLVASYVSTMIGMRLPGPGSLWMQQKFRWRNPVFIGDTLEFTLRITQKSQGARLVSFEVRVMNQHGKVVMDGEGAATLPAAKENESDIPVEKRAAFISGGARGIGAAVALALARAGAAVAINYWKSADAAEHLCQLITSEGGRAMVVRADVNDASSVERAVQEARGRFKQTIDVLIHCAGGAPNPRAVMEMEWDDIQRALDTHVKSAFHCVRALVPGMVQQKSGRIVHIGSMATWNTPPAQWSAYTMAKAALKSFTKALAVELGPCGIQVNMISPGITESGMGLELPERQRKLWAIQTPLRRLTAPEDVADVAVFLCSEASRFLTGADIPVCGGMGM